MSQYVILQNPLSISSTTSVKKQDYYLVYNFDSSDNTKLMLNGRNISRVEAENYEIRYYPDGPVNEKISEFKTDYTESIIIGIAFAFFIGSTLILGK